MEKYALPPPIVSNAPPKRIPIKRILLFIFVFTIPYRIHCAASSFRKEASNSSPDTIVNPIEVARVNTTACEAHGFTDFDASSLPRKRRVYDLVMIHTELDFLEIRLDTLYDHVDYFIIVESPVTFTGLKKRMALKKNWSRFKKYHEKMVYHQLTFPRSFKASSPWDIEEFQRNAMLNQAFPALPAEKKAVEGDVLLVSDMDEIPRPESVELLRSCDFPRRLTLASRFYYYSFQFLHEGAEWHHPQATVYRGKDTIAPSNLRSGKGGFFPLRELDKATLANASWHCSSCFSSIDQLLDKMSSFSHEWMNSPEFRNASHIVDAVRQGKDIWGRKVDRFRRLADNADVPPILLKEKRKFSYMLSRNGSSAGFTDLASWMWT